MSFTDRIKNFFKLKKALSEETFEDLADLLVEGDFGAKDAYEITDSLRSRCKKEHIGDAEQAKLVLLELLESILLAPTDTQADIILLLGVNGVGKTTSAAKLAAQYLQAGKHPILAAADTFRAAAIEQLKIHGERLGIRVVAHKHGGDPAAVVFDAIAAQQAGGADLIIADTAGRMHTKAALVEELKKIDRVVALKAAGACYRKWLVLDVTTGRNALAQAQIFHDAVSIDAVILTKYDSSARGGIAFSLATELKLPVIFVCSGERYGDIAPFDPHRYAKEFIGLS
ncbi:MAG: signal recognition particle-docking protein FtsY [Spirochaetaceae bacterium]|jgi:fused signal recognition particle receptor|nr:signal recognition particle-docking protein FtsY [Spirochaetaceae bacterium]